MPQKISINTHIAQGSLYRSLLVQYDFRVREERRLVFRNEGGVHVALDERWGAAQAQ